MTEFNYIDLGLIDYKECWDLQEKLLAKIIEEKLSTGKPVSQNYFLLAEHPHVYTLGKSGNEKNLLIDTAVLQQIQASYYKINRGGDITYHGPGQVVGYPVIDLEFYKIGVRKYIETMENAVIATIAQYGLQGARKEGATGVWLGVPERKICAIGVRVSRCVTMHGFALNVNTDMHYFNYINPCGTAHKVTSIGQELGKEISVSEIKELLKANFNRAY